MITSTMSGSGGWIEQPVLALLNTATSVLQVPEIVFQTAHQLWPTRDPVTLVFVQQLQ